MREVSVGETLDQFKLTDVIARSGMASIFKATDLISGQTVAIKVPYLQFESDVIFYGRFQRDSGKSDHNDHRSAKGPPSHDRLLSASRAGACDGAYRTS